jgi:ubiquinone/menaquinone biosynthesis C-methylase UbiE
MESAESDGALSPRARLALELARDAYARGDARTALNRFSEAVEQAPRWAARLNTDPMLELMMTGFRRWLALAPDLIVLPELAPCVAALMTQGRLNEFVFYETAEEKAALTDPRVRPMYRSDEPYAPPRDFERLGTIDDPVSRKVAEQYEANPYPRWMPSGLPEPGDFRAKLHMLCERHGLPTPPAAGSVLVAGCGTGRHAMHAAIGFGSDAQVVATDLSRTSLAYAAARCEEAGVANIRFLHADILALGALGRRFDMILCSGVLHHMADLLAGWRILVELLEPQGIMSIGLYSAIARRVVTMFLELYPPDERLPIEDRIRDFRYRIIRARAATWQAGGVRTGDFFTMSGCRDIFFHVHETRMTIGDIARALNGLGLRFLEFAPPRSIAGQPPLQDLEAWAPFEEQHPGLFVGMYQFWCAKR